VPDGEDEAGPVNIRPSVVWASSFGIWAFISLAATMTIYQMYRLSNGSMHFRTIAGMEFSHILSYAPLTPFAFALAMRYPVQRSNWKSRSLLHLAAGMVFTLGHIAIRGATPFGYWDPAHREWTSAFWNSYAHTFRAPWSVIKSMFLASVVDDLSSAYVPIVLIAHALSYYRRFQEKELRTTQLEGQLTKARLQTLKSQMQPHFLFNTLHSISALMMTDVVAADRMMTSLSDLLRMSLENNGTQLTTLNREIEFLNVYLDIEKARFEDRLKVFLDVAPECLDAQVPHLLLQPLVENAVRHGISKRALEGEIRVVAKRAGHNLDVWIRDNGPGLADPPEERSKLGLGLSVTRERLLTLYGDQQRCEIRNGAEGGAEVHLLIPFKVAPEMTRAEIIAHA
jgi:signal transduction histidine kinase